MKEPEIIAFGEVLWDVFPNGKLAGGAPMNVAYHLEQLGHHTAVISAVGKDDLGKEMLAFLHRKGLSTELVQQHPEYPTGQVLIQLDAAGIATYEFLDPVAWDAITLEQEAKGSVAASRALVFGTLACRHSQTRNSLHGLLQLADFRVFDVNLRPPFYEQALVEELLPQADLVKLNDEELGILSSWQEDVAEIPLQMKLLRNRYSIPALLVTKGPEGAEYLSDAGHFSVPGITVKVVDTVGSGDAFLAGFLSELLAGKDPQACLNTAARLGAFLATCTGATPEYEVTDVLDR